MAIFVIVNIDMNLIDASHLPYRALVNDVRRRGHRLQFSAAEIRIRGRSRRRRAHDRRRRDRSDVIKNQLRIGAVICTSLLENKSGVKILQFKLRKVTR